MERISKALTFSLEEVWQPANGPFGLLKPCCDALKRSNLFRKKHPRFYGAKHLYDKTPATSRNAGTVLLFWVAQYYLTSLERREEDFAVHWIYKAGAQCVSALSAFFSEVRRHKLFLFPSSGFDGFMYFEITLTKSSKTKINNLNVFANWTCLSRWDQGECMGQFAGQWALNNNSNKSLIYAQARVIEIGCPILFFAVHQTPRLYRGKLLCSTYHYQTQTLIRYPYTQG